jgi:hypothetical protein
MPKSKNTKDHKKRLAKYKANKKIEQDSFKKKLIDNYMKMQQDALAQSEAHTSTEDVEGPSIDIDELNQIEDWESTDDIPEVPVDLFMDDVVIENIEIENPDKIE